MSILALTLSHRASRIQPMNFVFSTKKDISIEPKMMRMNSTSTRIPQPCVPHTNIEIEWWYLKMYFGTFSRAAVYEPDQTQTHQAKRVCIKVFIFCKRKLNLFPKEWSHSAVCWRRNSKNILYWISSQYTAASSQYPAPYGHGSASQWQYTRMLRTVLLHRVHKKAYGERTQNRK